MLIYPYRGGVVIEEGKDKIVVDARVPLPGATHVVTHAHMDHMGAATRVPAFATNVTAEIAGRRGIHLLPLREYERLDVGELSLQLVPAGHIPGSAQVLVENGKRILVSGDFKLEKDMMERGAEEEETDVLIVETTFGRPEYVFPPRRELYPRLLEYVQRALDNGEHVLLLAYEVGKAQEVTALLNTKNLRPLVLPSTHRVNALFGLDDVVIGSEGWREYLNSPSVFLLPPRYRDLATPLALSTGRRVRTLFVSGWSKRMPISSHADYRQTIAYIERVDPEFVITYGENALPLARVLRRLGYNAQPLLRPIFV